MRRRPSAVVPCPITIDRRDHAVIRDRLDADRDLVRRIGATEGPGTSVRLPHPTTPDARAAHGALADAVAAVLAGERRRGTVRERAVLERLRLAAVGGAWDTPASTLEGLATALEHAVDRARPWLMADLPWCPVPVLLAMADARHHEATRNSHEHVHVRLIGYSPSHADDDDPETAPDGVFTHAVSLFRADVERGKTVAGALARHGLRPATDADIAAARAHAAAARALAGPGADGDGIGRQILVDGVARLDGVSWGDRHGTFGGDDGPERAVVDRPWPAEDPSDGDGLTRRLDVDGVDDPVPAPIVPFVAMFGLGRHMEALIHAGVATAYAYDDRLADKLVLDDDHRTMLDAVLRDDTVAGAGDLVRGTWGGAVVLLHGPPGTGKTLTAMVYAERLHRPLYAVQAAQLGVSITDLEERLREVLQRARRWRAVLLIDEADVYVHVRGADLVQNAIVGTFLRLFDAHRGVMFLTTNRPDVVDDAIRSRAICAIGYAAPSTDEARRRLWRIIADHHRVPMDDAAIAAVASAHPALSGRDVRQIIRLCAARIAAGSATAATPDGVASLLRYRPTGG